MLILEILNINASVLSVRLLLVEPLEHLVVCKCRRCNVYGNVTIGGTLTYEDSNIDAVEAITAQSDIKLVVVCLLGVSTGTKQFNNITKLCN